MNNIDEQVAPIRRRQSEKEREREKKMTDEYTLVHRHPISMINSINRQLISHSITHHLHRRSTEHKKVRS